MVSDTFPPQGYINLLALVAYNRDPVNGKVVSYNVYGPEGSDVHFFGTATSDKIIDPKTGEEAEGIANYTFLIQNDPKRFFGVWNVYASVEIAGVVVNDTLWFRVDYPIRVNDADIILERDLVYKGDSAVLNVTLTVTSMQDPRECMRISGAPTENIILAVTVTDNLSQLIFNGYLMWSNVEIKAWVVSVPDIEAARFNFVTEKENRTHFDGTHFIIYVPYWAYSGKATIHVNVFTSLPGVPYCTEGTATFNIKKK
jgi:hypothetical protein